MFQTYDETLAWIHSRLRLGIKPGLSRMEWMMEKLGHPERRLKTVHIGGTNGKGSTVVYLRSILQEAGYKVGTFTSPYFEQFNERISVNGVPLLDQDLVKAANVIKPLSDELEKTELGGPTEFEIITAISFYYFTQINPVDLVLYEVGLGGRFDSTNIIHPLLSIITSIGLDHTNILGDTHAEIAYEKAGIIKNGVSVITAVKQKEAIEVIKEQASAKRAPLYELDRQFKIENHHSVPKGESFSINTLFGNKHDLEIAMVGRHQTENAALAIMASMILNQYCSFLVEEEHLKSGLKKAYWPGRFEIVSDKPLIVIDGAHNEEGMTTLVQEIGRRYEDRKKKVIFAALSDKKLDRMIHQLDSIADQITFVDFDFPRAASASDLFEISTLKNKHTSAEWELLFAEEIDHLKENEMLVITGSLYFLSEAKKVLVKLLENNYN